MKPLLTLLLLFATSASAYTISWGGAADEIFLTSAGAPLDASYSFNLGTFGPSFIPTETNRDSWLSNWKVLDRATSADGWDINDGFVSSVLTIQTDGTSNSPYASPSTTFALGEPAYMWIYNSPLNADGNEWALISGIGTGTTSNTVWTTPSPADQTSPPANWRFDTASTLTYGGLNDTQGPGDYSSNPSTFTVQTAAVPEPSSLLLALAALGLTLRRKRK